MVIVKYRVIKTPYITDQEYSDYSDFILKTLTDPRGWIKYGYVFSEDSSKDSNDNSKIIKVRFFTNDAMVKKYGKSIDRLSAYVPSEHAVYFNLQNWNNGTWEGLFPPLGNEDGLTRYRQYVINHELGHALGLEHPECKSGKVSVMEQNTKGLTWLNRCMPDDKKNREYTSWPLDKNIYDEEEGDGDNHLKYKVKGGDSITKKKLSIYINFLIATLVFLILIIILCRFIKLISEKFNSSPPNVSHINTYHSSNIYR